MNQQCFDPNSSPQDATSEASTAFVAGTVQNAAIASALFGAWYKWRNQESFKTVFKDVFTSKVTWGISAVVGLLDAYFAYRKAQQVNHQFKELVHDNIAMRQGLNQTGQILFQVARQIEAGKIADNSFQFNTTTAPAVHVVRLQTARAAQAASAALSGTEVKPTTHAETVQAEKQTAAETEPALH